MRKPSKLTSLRFQHPSIEQRPVASLKLGSRIIRTHSRSQRRKLKRIIKAVGFIDPIVVDENDEVVAGVLRLEVAKDLELETVPVIQINHLNAAEKRAYALAANRIAEDAGWDKGLLALELGELAILLPEVGIELEVTGFELSEIDQIFADNGDQAREADEGPTPTGPNVTRLGDLWVCGESRVHCADALIHSNYVKLMGTTRAAMTFADPPYNVSVRKHARGKSGNRFDEFQMASGELDGPQFQNFLTNSLGLVRKFSVHGGLVFVCMDWAHVRHLLNAGESVFDELKNVCVWVKSNGGMGTFYRSRHELVCIFKVGQEPHINTFQLGQHGRSRTNVWEYSGLSGFKAGRDDELAMHPTTKPVRMIADAMLDCSKPRSIILDPFLGSGSTLIAGETVGRHVYGLEIDPRYVDVTIRRWQAFTGKDAVLGDTNETFEDVSRSRNSANDELQATKQSTTPRRPRHA